jgi:DNA-binding Lrp family transcriptional regulator
MIMHSLFQEGDFFQSLDDLDKKIIQEMTKGIKSYEELAQNCGVTRSTVYRRITNLEKKKIITHQIRIALDFEKLGLMAINFGISIEPKHEEEVVDALKKLAFVKMVWRTYGAHDIEAIAFCDRGEEGETVCRMRQVLGKFNVTHFETCVGYSWDKNDTTPF